MAGDAFRKVATGERLRIPAGAYNAFIDAAQDFQRRQREIASRKRDVQTSTGIVMVRNDSGADRERFEILGVSGPLYGPSENLEEFKNRPAIIGVMPSEDDHMGRFVILMEPVKAGRMARAMAVGVSPVRLVMNEPEEGEDEHEFADVDDGSAAHLTSAASGAAAILWKESSTGECWALVRFPAGGGAASGEAEAPRWQPAPA